MAQQPFDPRTYLVECIVRALVDNGIKDPDALLFLGVLGNDVKKVQEALDSGANPNVTDTELVRRHFEVLVKPPISERLALAVIAIVASPMGAAGDPLKPA